MQTITLATKEQLDIYINPQRQRLLRFLAITARPMTPKELSVALGISASATQHHIARLVSLGVVALSHTKQIRGITAHYYHALPVTVRIGYGSVPEEQAQRIAIIQNSVNNVLGGYIEHASAHAATSPAVKKLMHQPDPAANVAIEAYQAAAETDAVDVTAAIGDVLTGVAHLRPQEAQQLARMVRAFLREHETATRDTNPWEYALIAYPVQEASRA